MNGPTVAHRYAHALYLVALKHGEVPGTLEDLKGLIALIDADPRIGAFMRSPLVPAVEKQRLLARALTGRVRPWVERFVDLLLRKKRLAFFRDAVAEYERLVEEWQGVQRAEAVSAVPLTAGETKRLHAELERLTGRQVRLATRVDAGLIGGLYVRIGDRVMDRSVKSLLATLEERLFEASV